MNCETFCWELSKDLALKAWKEYARNSHQRLYLYADKAQDEVFINFQIGNDDVKDKAIVIQEHIPCNRTLQALNGWFNERLRRCSIIPITGVWSSLAN